MSQAATIAASDSSSSRHPSGLPMSAHASPRKSSAGSVFGMSSPSIEMTRSDSRAGSISTLWSSADVPFLLDSRVSRAGSTSFGEPPFRTSISDMDRLSTADSAGSLHSILPGARRQSSSASTASFLGLRDDVGPARKASDTPSAVAPSLVSSRSPSQGTSDTNSLYAVPGTPRSPSTMSPTISDSPTRLQRQKPAKLTLDSAAARAHGKRPADVVTVAATTSAPKLGLAVSMPQHKYQQIPVRQPAMRYDQLYGQASRFFDMNYTMGEGSRPSPVVEVHPEPISEPKRDDLDNLLHLYRQAGGATSSEDVHRLRTRKPSSSSSSASLRATSKGKEAAAEWAALPSGITVSPPIREPAPYPPSTTVTRPGLASRIRTASTPRLRPRSSSKNISTSSAGSPTRSAQDDATPLRPAAGGVTRLRSRTLGAEDRRPSTSDAVPPVPSLAPLSGRQRPSSTEVSFVPTQNRARRPSRCETLSSSVSSSSQSFLQTPVTPVRTTSTAASSVASTKTTSRPKSKSGWASHLSNGLTLHFEVEGRRESLKMGYLYYDPFGRANSLCERGTAESRPSTPKRPRSNSGPSSAPPEPEEQTGVLEFGLSSLPPTPSTPTSLLCPERADPVLRHLTIGDDTTADLLSRQATLSVKVNGTHEVSGSERKGRLGWRFVYNVDDEREGPRRNSKILRPVSFSCSATLLDPVKARKGRLLNMLKKNILSSSITSNQVVGSPASSTVPLTDHSSASDKGSVMSSQTSYQGSSTFSRQGSRQLQSDWSEVRQQQASVDMGSQPHSPVRAVNVAAVAPPRANLVPFKMTRGQMIAQVRSGGLSPHKLSNGGTSSGATSEVIPSPGLTPSYSAGSSLAIPSPTSPGFVNAHQQHRSRQQLSPHSPARHLEGEEGMPARRRGSIEGVSPRSQRLALPTTSDAPLALPVPIRPLQASPTAATRADGRQGSFSRGPSEPSRPQTASEEIKAAYLLRSTASASPVAARRLHTATGVSTPASSSPGITALRKESFFGPDDSSSPASYYLDQPRSLISSHRPTTAETISASSPGRNKRLPQVPPARKSSVAALSSHSSRGALHTPTREERERSERLFDALQQQGWL